MPIEELNPLSDFIVDDGVNIPVLDSGKTARDSSNKSIADKVGKKKQDEPVTPPQDTKIPDSKVVENLGDTSIVNTPTEETVENIEDNSLGLKSFLEYNAQKGLFELPEDYEDTEEGFAKFFKSSLDKGIQDFKKSEIDTLPEDVKELISFVKNGGNQKEFYDLYYSDASFQDVDPKGNEDLQKYILETFYRSKGYSETEVQKQLKRSEDIGALEEDSLEILPKLQQMEKQAKEDLVKQQEAKAKQKQEETKAFWTNLEKDWFAKKDLNGFQLTDGIKKNVWEHMTKPVKDGKTQLQLNYNTNKDTQFLYAYLDMLGWNIDSLKKQVRTEVTKEFKAKLNNWGESKDRLSSATPQPTEGFSMDSLKGLEQFSINNINKNKK